jgi:DNA-binding GntR family transcriptional regulator
MALADKAPADKTLGIQRRALHDEAAERLRGLVLSGELEPGSRVNELELSERFGISRTPLREAIKVLASEGLLDLLPNRGARVARISVAEIEDMIEVVAGLEATAGELACRHITDPEIDAVQTLHLAMLDAWKAEDEPRYFTLNREIHEAIMAASRNATLAGIYANLSSRIQRMRYTAHKTAAQWQRAVDEHEQMIVLLRKRDGSALATLMKEHIRGKAVVIAAAYGLGNPDPVRELRR